jgi:lysophospholipase L1-like esterase
VTASEPPPVPAREVLLSRPVRALGVLLGLAVAVELVPALARLRLFGERPARVSTANPLAPLPSASVGAALIAAESENRGAVAAVGPHARGPIAAAAEAEPLPEGKNAPPLPLEDPSGHALDAFYAVLARADAKEPRAIARIAHFGDSLIVSDFVSGTLRRSFQRRFGDAGHGFVLMANAWPSYFHWDVDRYATGGWEVSRIVGPYAADGWYGLGGVSFSADKNVLARVGTASDGAFGRNVSRFVVAYVDDPAGGRFQIRVDGVDREVVDTRATEKRSRFHEVALPDGAHELEVQTLAGKSRLFGVVLEREGPGVVLDALGVQGARIRFLDKQDDAHWAEQLRWRRPDLVVYEFGANESGDGFVYSMEDFHRTMREVLEQTRRALPTSSCLVVATMDRAAKQGDEIVSVRVVPALVEEQRKVALELGCAFFDTYHAMGGKGSMPIWVRRGLGQADLTHPTGAGAERLGNWIYGAIMRGYSDFRARPASAAPSGNSSQ